MDQTVDAWLEEMRPRLVRLAQRFLGSAHDADEAAQEALLLAWRRARDIRDATKRNAWLYRTTVNVSMNHLRAARSLRRARANLAADRDAAASEPECRSDLRERVRLAVAELPERQQAALVLRELEGLEYERIAAILETRPAAARVLVHRARESVRQILLRRWPDSFGPDR